MGKSKTHTVTQLRPNTFTLAVWNNTVRTTAPPCLLTNLNYIFKEQFLEKCNYKYFWGSGNHYFFSAILRFFQEFYEPCLITLLALCLFVAPSSVTLLPVQRTSASLSVLWRTGQGVCDSFILSIRNSTFILQTNQSASDDRCRFRSVICSEDSFFM